MRIQLRTNDGPAVWTEKIDAAEYTTGMNLAGNVCVDDEFGDQLVTPGAFSASHFDFLVFSFFELNKEPDSFRVPNDLNIAHAAKKEPEESMNGLKCRFSWR